jgi:type IV pilus assembly protein PilP
MRVLTSISFAVLLTSAAATTVSAQLKSAPTPAKATPTPAPAAAPRPADDASKTAAPANEQAKVDGTEAYTYEPSGRRDPFLTLIGPTTDMRSKKGEGAAGMAVNEISVRGVLESKGKLVAMVKGPDNKTYIVHQGDRLLDGAIRSITPQGLVIEQEVNDPLSVVKQREVRKLLRGLEETK